MTRSKVDRPEVAAERDIGLGLAEFPVPSALLEAEPPSVKTSCRQKIRNSFDLMPKHAGSTNRRRTGQGKR